MITSPSGIIKSEHPEVLREASNQCWPRHKNMSTEGEIKILQPRYDVTVSRQCFRLQQTMVTWCDSSKTVFAVTGLVVSKK